MFGAENEHSLHTTKNFLFMQNINDICAVCVQQHENLRTSSMQDMLLVQDKIEVYKILESISLFKYSAKTPQLLCKTCSFKLLNFYEFQQMCNKSYFYFTNYINQKDTLTNTDEENDVSRMEDPDAEDYACKLEIGDTQIQYLESDKEESMESIHKSSTEIQASTDEKNDISRMEDSDAEDYVCTFEIEDTQIEYLQSGSKESLKSVPEQTRKILPDSETVRADTIERDGVTNESSLIDHEEGSTIELTEHGMHHEGHLGLNKKENCIDVKKGTDSKFVCQYCNKVFGRKLILINHENLHTGDKPYKCDQCPKAYASKCSLTYHKISHRAERPFVCNICANTFKHRKILKLHTIRVHTNDNTGENVSQAFKGTTKVSPEAKILRTNTTAIHETDRIDHEVDSIVELTKHGAHRKGHIGLNKKENCIDAKRGTGSKFVCKYCNKVCGKKVLLMNHENLHTGEKPYKCDQCPKAYASATSRNSHKYSHRIERSFVCNICAKTFKDNGSLKQHIKHHVYARRVFDMRPTFQNP